VTDNKLVADFQRLLNDTRADGAESALFLRLMEPKVAEQFRLCAIPHQFDARMLRVLDPDLDEEQARRRCDEFSRLSAVTPVGDTWAIHDKWRHEIFANWLRAEDYPEFQSASRRLADFFDMQVNETSGEAQASALRSRMYHLLGADQTAGFGEFERLCRRARDQFRLTECAALIRLAHDYDAVLAPNLAAVLAYHEGKLASDQRDWKKAEQLFTRVIQLPAAAPRLRAQSYLRLGSVYGEQGKYLEAIEVYARAREIAEADDEAAKIMPRILHEVGAAHRDLGDMNRAEQLLKESADRAAMQQGWGTYAIAYNSLGRLYLNQHDARKAIAAFQTALDKLEHRDALRSSQVYNNMGLAHLELGDWPGSESWFMRSLDIKRRSGDVLGQALALNNLSRVYVAQERLEQAVVTATQAAEYFEIVGDLAKTGIAKQNLGKFYRKLGKNDLARETFVEAIELFAKINDASGEAAVRTDLKNFEAKDPRFPLWAKLTLGILGLSVLLFFVGLVLFIVLN
jgi:tetratricopeptide (TPR) repeat protein